MNAQEIARTAVILVLWVIAIGAVIALLAGCESLTERDKREGAFRVHADFQEDTISVEFELDQHGEEEHVEVKR